MKYQVIFHVKTWYRCIFTHEKHMLHVSLNVKRLPLLGLYKIVPLAAKVRLFRVCHWCFYDKFNITWPLGDKNFSSSVEQHFTRECSEQSIFFTYSIFFTWKFLIYTQPCNILYVSHLSPSIAFSCRNLSFSSRSSLVFVGFFVPVSFAEAGLFFAVALLWAFFLISCLPFSLFSCFTSAPFWFFGWAPSCFCWSFLIHDGRTSAVLPSFYIYSIGCRKQI